MRSVSTSKAPSTTITAGDEHACSKPSSGLEPRNARYFGGDSSSLLGGGQLQERLGGGPNGWAEPGAAEQAFVVSAAGCSIRQLSSCRRALSRGRVGTGSWPSTPQTSRTTSCKVSRT